MATPQMQWASIADDDPRRMLYQSYLEYCNAHDVAGMMTFYTSPMNVNDRPLAPSKVMEQFKPIFEAFPDWRWEVRHFGVDGDYLGLHFKVMGTHMGTFQGIPATGRSVTTTQFTLYHLVDGKYADVWDLTDMDSVIKQIQ